MKYYILIAVTIYVILAFAINYRAIISHEAATVIKKQTSGNSFLHSAVATTLRAFHKSKDWNLAHNEMQVVRPAPNQPREIFWMHIQKTSTWFGEFLLMWACPKLAHDYENGVIKIDDSGNTTVGMVLNAPPDVFTHNSSCQGITILPGRFRHGYHHPYSGSYRYRTSNGELAVQNVNGSTMTLFRNPLNRVVSAFFFTENNDGCPMLPIGFPDRVNRAQQLKDYIYNSPIPILTYATLPGIASCQLKMVMGFHCGEPITMTKEDLIEAKHRIRNDFLFIGLTEESRATHDLFLAMFGGKTCGGKNESAPLPYDIHIRRNLTISQEHRHNVTNTLMSLWKDELEDELYDEAKRIFYTRCQQYGVRTKLLI